LSVIPFMVHQGMTYVPLGYRAPAIQFDNSYSHGVSPYGPSTLAGPKGERTPLEGELEAARVMGETLANTTKALKIGRAAIAAETAAK
jgi:NAD(P)H dehydrogenase (quinone)